jgi:hypothetical protein
MLMSRQTISLKSRVRYEGRVRTFDRRGDLEKLPNPLWRTVSQVLHANFRKPAGQEAKLSRAQGELT